MKPPIKTLLPPVAAMIALVLLVAWMAGLFSEKIQPGLNAPLPAPAAQTMPVEQWELPLFEPVPASVEAKQATIISSRIMARITEVHVRAGDSVTAGQLLLKLEQSDLLARAQQSRERIKAVQARLTEAEQSLARTRQLYQQGLVAAADLDRARANRDELQAELASARQALEEAETAVGFTEIRSPIDGRVVDRFAEPGDTATPGSRLLSLYNPLLLRIEARVREQLALALEEGQKLEVEVPALHKALSAEVEERVPVADPGSRSFLIKARVQYDKRLLPGMYARLKIPAGKEHALLIPDERVASAGQLDVVWVLENGQAAKRFVRTGRAIEVEPGSDYIEIIAGLNAGEKVLPVPPPVSP